MLSLFKEKASPAMIVAIIAIVFATTGSAFAARSLLTGADIEDGSITRADLASTAVGALKAKAKRGPRGVRGPVGPPGEQGPAGLIGPQGERGPAGATGPTGPVGPHGSTGERGEKGATGETGLTGDTGPAGQTLVQDAFTPVGAPVELLTPLAIADPFGEGTDLVGDMPLATGQYRVDVTVRFSDLNATDPALEYGVGRLFLSGFPLDGVTTDDIGGGFTSVDTTIVTPDIPDDGTNTADATASFVIFVGDDLSGGEVLTLRGVVRGDETDGGTAIGHVIVSRIAS